MSDLPDPTQPAAFLRALAGEADLRGRAERAGCDVHALTDANPADPAATAALVAAGARALAATLARGARPILLVSQGTGPDQIFATALAEGLMGYERIFALIGAPSGARDAVEVIDAPDLAGLRLILILPPTGTNSYWQR